MMNDGFRKVVIGLMLLSLVLLAFGGLFVALTRGAAG